MPPLLIDLKELKEKASEMKERIKQREKERILFEKANAMRKSQNKDGADKGKLHQLHQLNVMYNLKTKDDLKNFAQVNSKTYDTTKMAKKGTIRRMDVPLPDNKNWLRLENVSNINILPDQETVDIYASPFYIEDAIDKVSSSIKAKNFNLKSDITNDKEFFKIIKIFKKSSGKKEIYIKELSFDLECFLSSNIDLSIPELQTLSKICINSFSDKNFEHLIPILKKIEKTKSPCLKIVSIKFYFSEDLSYTNEKRREIFEKLKSINFNNLPKIILSYDNGEYHNLKEFVKEKRWLSNKRTLTFQQDYSLDSIYLSLETESFDDITEERIENLNKERQNILKEHKMDHIFIESLICSMRKFPPEGFSALKFKEFAKIESLTLSDVNSSDIYYALIELINLRKEGYIKLLDDVNFYITDKTDAESIRNLIEASIKKEDYMYLPMSVKIIAGLAGKTLLEIGPLGLKVNK